MCLLKGRSNPEKADALGGLKDIEGTSPMLSMQLFTGLPTSKGTSGGLRNPKILGFLRNLCGLLNTSLRWIRDPLKTGGHKRALFDVIRAIRQRQAKRRFQACPGWWWGWRRLVGPDVGIPML